MLHMDLFADRRGGRNVGEGDIYVSLHNAGTGNNGSDRMALSIRFREECLDTLRWRRGDRVLLGFDIDADNVASMTFSRSSEDDARALTIHANGNKSSGATVRKTISAEQARTIFPEGVHAYAGTLNSGDAKRATFTLEKI